MSATPQILRNNRQQKLLLLSNRLQPSSKLHWRQRHSSNRHRWQPSNKRRPNNKRLQWAQ
jgi:hypothetical protein